MMTDDPYRTAGPGELDMDMPFDDPYDREPELEDLPPRQPLDFGVMRDTTCDTNTRLLALEDPAADVEPITAQQVLRNIEAHYTEQRYREAVLEMKPESMKHVSTGELRIMRTYAQRYQKRYAERERLFTQIVADREARCNQPIVRDDNIPAFLRLTP